MKFYDLITTSLRTLCNKCLRVILAALGIAIGIAILTIALSIMAGFHLTVNKTLAGFGGKYLAISSDRDPALSRSEGKKFTVEDALAIRGVSGVTMISLQKSNQWVPVTHRNQQIQTDIIGTDLNFLTICNRKIEKGRFIGDQDIYNQHRVCVITEGVKRRFFPTADYLDQKLEINGTVFRIIGCLEPMLMPAFFINNPGEGTIFIPLTTSQKIFQQYDFDLILLQYAKAYEKKREIKLLKGRIEGILKFRNGDASGYVLKTLDESVAKQKKMVLYITIISCTLAAVFLLVGGIGIMNLMFNSAIERGREIGSPKTIGIYKYEALSLFLGESIIISTTGGLAGLIFGIIGARILAIFGGIPVCITWWILVLDIGIMLLTGSVFGFYPTRKGASIQPVECLQ